MIVLKQHFVFCVRVRETKGRKEGAMKGQDDTTAVFDSCLTSRLADLSQLQHSLSSDMPSQHEGLEYLDGSLKRAESDVFSH